jgi:small subunit ribosomal protein S5
MAMQQQQQGRRMRRSPGVVEEKQFDERTLDIDRVARVVKGGRRFRFRALVVLGDHKGGVGMGIAKGADVTAAITKATEAAKKNMLRVPLYKTTLPHDVEAKVGGARILIKPASAGTGLIAGSVVRTMLEIAGVSDVLSKSLGSSNKTNTAYATMAALRQIVPASEWVRKPKHATTQVEPKAEKPEAEAKVAPKSTAKPTSKGKKT